jgi:putative (di)nucleoside polyphosphate hydrolase
MYRKGVSALIINKKDEFLLVNLLSFEDKYFAVPGGGLEENETLKDAAYREINEELGINKSELEFIGESKNPLKTTFITPKIDKKGNRCVGSERLFFGFRFIGEDNDIKIKEDEVSSYKWVPFSELGKYLLFDCQLDETSGKIDEIFDFLL